MKYFHSHYHRGVMISDFTLCAQCHGCEGIGQTASLLWGQDGVSAITAPTLAQIKKAALERSYGRQSHGHTSCNESIAV